MLRLIANRMRWWKVLVALVALVALLCVGAQGDIPTEDPCDLIMWLMTSTGVNFIVFGPILSILVEYLPLIGVDWASLDHRLKRPVMGLICLVVPVAALLVGAQLCGLVITLDAIYTVVMAGLAAFAGSQFAHIRQLDSGGR